MAGTLHVSCASAPTAGPGQSGLQAPSSSSMPCRHSPLGMGRHFAPSSSEMVGGVNVKGLFMQPTNVPWLQKKEIFRTCLAAWSVPYSSPRRANPVDDWEVACPFSPHFASPRPSRYVGPCMRPSIVDTRTIIPNTLEIDKIRQNLSCVGSCRHIRVPTRPSFCVTMLLHAPTPVATPFPTR